MVLGVVLVDSSPILEDVLEDICSVPKVFWKKNSSPVLEKVLGK